MSFSRELEVARSVAVRAGKLAMRYATQGVTAETKPDDSPVTIADKESEKLIAAALLEAFPDDGLLGEEGSARESRSGRQWIIDPIDGTRDFLRGNPFWAVLIGLEANGEAVAGVCHMPALGETYHAARSSGAWKNDAPIRASKVQSPDQAVLCMNGINNAVDHPFGSRLLEFASRFWAVRSVGGCLDAMMIASGRADAWIEPTAKPWDLAPLKVIIEEAGGRFFNFDGGSTIYGGNCIACVPALEAEMRRFVGAAAAAR
jgi:histidinol-phosphatase